jgi:GNAT superfamily N-acetyltransferase
VEQFLAAAGDLILGDPALHTITLTVCENVRARQDGTRFAWWQEASGDVTGCVSQTPPYPVVLAVVPEHAMEPLVSFWQVDGVNGPVAVAAQVAALAARHSGRTATLRTSERMFRLRQLVPPDVPGTPRVASTSDTDLLVTWFEAFIAEADVIGQDVEKAVRDRLRYQGFVLWEDRGPVALAGHTRKAFQGMRIGPVYTPPEHRRHGYGGAVTAAASQQALDRGATEVVLFTDLTNPTSNALYPRLGYEPVTDRAVFLLSG